MKKNNSKSLQMTSVIQKYVTTCHVKNDLRTSEVTQQIKTR